MDEVKTNAERLAAIQAAAEEQAVAWIERMQSTGAIERRVRDELDKRAGSLPALDDDSVASLRGEYTRVLKYELGKALRKRAEADAAAMLDEIVASATGGDA